MTLPGTVNLSTGVQLVAPAAVVKGTLSITASELYFEVEEDEPSFKAIDPKVRDPSSTDHDPDCHLAPPLPCMGGLHASFMFEWSTCYRHIYKSDIYIKSI